MNVKISYTVGMEEVPQVINEMLSDCKQKLTVGSNKLKYSFNYPRMIEDLNDVRETLILVEQKVQDAINITSGWLEAQQEQEEKAEEPLEFLEEINEQIADQDG